MSLSTCITLSLFALEKISERDPQSDTCGPAAPDICENGCVGCIARAALGNIRSELEALRYLGYCTHGAVTCPQCEESTNGA